MAPRTWENMVAIITFKVIVQAVPQIILNTLQIFGIMIQNILADCLFNLMLSLLKEDY
jgi:hypothetical protein